MNLNDLVHLKGEVLIQEVSDNGEITTLVDDRNLIVSYGRNTLCKLLSGEGGSVFISNISFGDGGTIAGNSNVALPVEPTDVAVKSALEASIGVDYSFTKTREETPSPRLVFNIVIPKEKLAGVATETKLNGEAISEIALTLTDTKAFAIKRFASISKSNAVSLIISWVIYI